jgi:acyl-coenzyme A synthetase/AMP-(fatty) acid ligase
MDRISDVINRYPNRRAFVDGEDTITYRELDIESAKVYHYLKDRQIHKEQFITIIMPKNVHFFSCVLGCWKAGAAYVLIEEGYPEERIDFIKKDSGSVLTLDSVLFEEIMRSNVPLEGYEETDLHDASYAVYTSGSTGTPKGVLHEYGNIDQCAAVTPIQEDYPEYIFGFTAALNFVAMQLYIIDAVVSAKTTILISGALLRNFNALQKTLEEHKVERVFLPPSFLLHYNHPCKYLKTIYTGSAPANDIFYPEGPEVMNTYGMSETGFFVLQTILDKSYDVAPVGKPTLPVEMCLLREDETLVEDPMERGELCLQNDFIRGYMNLPERTAAAFRPAPWDPSLRLFHTGDIAYRDENGNYYIAGRSDDMIKIDGNRIEPAEIEAAVKRITGLEDVMARGFQEKTRAYTAVYFLEKEATEKGVWDGKQFYIDWGALTKMLPYYMLPAYFVNMKEFPKNANGKLVRKELPAPDENHKTSEYMAPVTPTQKKLCEAFEKVLKREKVGIKDDFYALGGDSMSTMELVSLLDIPGITPMDIFKNRTPEKIALSCENNTGKSAVTLEEREKEARGNAYPLTGFQVNMFDSQLYAPQTCMWNIPILFTFNSNDVNCNKLGEAVNKATEHHPIFRTVLEFDANGLVVQRYRPELDCRVEPQKLTKNKFLELKKSLNHPFRLMNAPLIYLKLFETEEEIHLLLYAHHIAIDGSGINVLLESIWDFYEGKEEHTIDTWYSWLDEELKRSEETNRRIADEYFEKEYGNKRWCRNLKTDSNTRNLSARIHTIQSDLTKDKLDSIKNKYHLSPNELCVALALLALSETEKEDNVMVNWVFQNRGTGISDNAVGLLIRLLPVGVTIKGGEALEDTLLNIGNHVRDSITNSSSEWCLDHENVYLNDALFIVYESTIMDIDCMKKRNAKMEFLPNPGMALIRRTSLQIADTEKGLIFHFFYIDEMYDKEHISAFLKSLEKWIGLLSV